MITDWADGQPNNLGGLQDSLGLYGVGDSTSPGHRFRWNDGCYELHL